MQYVPVLVRVPARARTHSPGLRGDMGNAGTKRSSKYECCTGLLTCVFVHVSSLLPLCFYSDEIIKSNCTSWENHRVKVVPR